MIFVKDNISCLTPQQETDNATIVFIFFNFFISFNFLISFNFFISFNFLQKLNRR